jgi:hypothetical protein
LEGCKARITRKVNRYYRIAELLDAREVWQKGEPINLGPGCYQKEGLSGRQAKATVTGHVLCVKPEREIKPIGGGKNLL